MESYQKKAIKRRKIWSKHAVQDERQNRAKIGGTQIGEREKERSRGKTSLEVGRGKTEQRR